MNPLRRATIITTISILTTGGLYSLFGATHYVSHSGNNTFPYTSWETATNSVNAANIAMFPGDTMFIDTGSYYLTAIVYTQPKITLRGKGMDSTRVFGSELFAPMFMPDDSTTVEDIHFDGIPVPGGTIGCSSAFAKVANTPNWNTVFSRCKFSHFLRDILTFDYTNAVEVSNCYFEFWNDDAISVVGAGYMYCVNNTFWAPDETQQFCDLFVNGYHKVFRNNIFVGGGFTGISGGLPWAHWEFTNNLFYQNEWLSLALAATGTDVVIKNNSFYLTDNHIRATDAIRIGGKGRERFDITNNIIEGFTPRISFFSVIDSMSAANTRIRYNCFFSRELVEKSEYIYYDPGITDFPDSIYANIYLDPMFADPTNGDLRLQYSSPAIDAGAPWILDVDGSRSDIGAFGGPGGSFYIYQDFPPKTPLEFEAKREDKNVRLSWLKNSESDLSFYILFRSDNLLVTLDSEHVLAYVSPSGSIIGLPPKPPHKRFPGFGDDSIRYFSAERPIPRYSLRNISLIRFIDSDLDTTNQYSYQLVAVDQSMLVSPPTASVTINPAYHEAFGSVSMPEAVDLEQNYPNPFNASTAIVYGLPNVGAQPAPVRLTIYNSLGQTVIELVNEKQFPGKHVVFWNGKDISGSDVSTGIYLYRLHISGLEFVKGGKMVLVN